MSMDSTIHLLHCLSSSGGWDHPHGAMHMAAARLNWLWLPPGGLILHEQALKRLFELGELNWLTRIQRPRLEP